MRSPTLLQVAWHEAVHAVAAWDRGFTVTLVSIRRIGDSYGRCQHTPAGDCAVPSEREREKIVAMAGWATELASGEALVHQSEPGAEVAAFGEYVSSADRGHHGDRNDRPDAGHRHQARTRWS